MSQRIKERLVPGVLAVFLFCFMVLIFGPAEIFFANVEEFDFLYQDFAGWLAALAVFCTAAGILLLLFLPERIYRVVLSLIFALSVIGYIQVMFLNRNLDLLGVNKNGYQADTFKAVVNLVIWCTLILLMVGLAFWKKEIWKKGVQYFSAFLLCIQIVAFASLFLTAKPAAFQREEGTWHLSGEEQFTVSANKNFIVIILDYFGNMEMEALLAAYPDAVDAFHDFTYYSNADCVYYGTYPSIPHMLSGNEINPGILINDWCASIWKEEKTLQFYDMLKENNYKANLYTPDTNILCGLNDVKILENCFSNVTDTSQEVDINSKLLFKTITKMSAYRLAPEVLKPAFYGNMGDYTRIANVMTDPVVTENFDFYEGLLNKGVSVDKGANYFIYQHLTGPHARTTTAEGFEAETETTVEETEKGCMVIVEEYLNQLKELGVYDNSTIIISSDHGDIDEAQVIFFMKQANETHEKSPVSNAPISWCELLPTVAEYVGVDYSVWGKSVNDFSADEQRERTVWLRWAYEWIPFVPCYTGDRMGNANCFRGYKYTGDNDDFLEAFGKEPAEVLPMTDSFF